LAPIIFEDTFFVVTSLISGNGGTIHIVIGIPFINNFICLHNGGRFWVCLFEIHLGHFLDATSGQQKKPQVFDFDMKTTNILHWKKSNRYKKKNKTRL
jgi:hypothetical protein